MMARMTKEELDVVWDRFEKKFEFAPSIYKNRWPSIKEPTPSVTFLFDRQIKTGQDVLDPDEIFIRAFQRLSHGCKMTYFLDWQHDCYKVKNFAPDDYHLGVFPDGDYHIWLSEDLECGVFGHPWEKSICVFGDNLMLLTRSMLVDIFGAPVRVNP